MNIVTVEEALKKNYDVVIVGGGISGALVAKTLSHQQKRCLIVEAGTATGSTYGGYLEFLKIYHKALIKIPNAPYPVNPNASEPLETDVQRISPDKPYDNGYFVQYGPLPFSSTYTRYLGGTTLHWLGTSLRMLPEDFSLKTLYNIGRDWPIRYEDMEPWYRKAEFELGVSAEVDEQSYLGVEFPKDYVYPMHALPRSWSDNQIAEAIDGLPIEDSGQTFHLKVRGTPASRNSIPNNAYNHGQGYRPRGAVGNPAVGDRCMGNSSCVPICPIQAKYNAFKTLNEAHTDYLDILPQSVASELLIDPTSQEITGIRIKHYRSPENPKYTEHVIEGKRYVLAAHAVSNAMLLLASGACTNNDLVGRHLMDHPELLAWGTSENGPLWPLRGPLATSGIEDMRTGAFRSQRAAFRMEMGNDGWLWPANAPESNVENAVDTKGMFGKPLRQALLDQVSHQFRFGILVEQLPEYENRVTIDPAFKDVMDNYRPIIYYDLSSYTKAGFLSASNTAQAIFHKANIKDASAYTPNQSGFFTYNGVDLSFNGAGHYAGTHCMGSTPENSVVNPKQRTWKHPNLYLVGCGNMVTMGTSNPTLTMSALTLWAAHNILDDLNGVCGA